MCVCSAYVQTCMNISVLGFTNLIIIKANSLNNVWLISYVNYLVFAIRIYKKFEYRAC